MCRDRRVRRFVAGLALAAGFMMIGVTPLYAQTTSASVSGSVKDAQAGVLPGATVTLKSETQGTEQTVVTDALGGFLFPFARPDTRSRSVWWASRRSRR